MLIFKNKFNLSLAYGGRGNVTTVKKVAMTWRHWVQKSQGNSQLLSIKAFFLNSHLCCSWNPSSSWSFVSVMMYLICLLSNSFRQRATAAGNHISTLTITFTFAVCGRYFGGGTWKKPLCHPSCSRIKSYDRRRREFQFSCRKLN